MKVCYTHSILPTSFDHSCGQHHGDSHLFFPHDGDLLHTYSPLHMRINHKYCNLYFEHPVYFKKSNIFKIECFMSMHWFKILSKISMHAL